MKFDHGAFQVSNMDESIEFYTKKLGFELVTRYDNEKGKYEVAFIRSGEVSIELIRDWVSPYQKPEIKSPYCPHLCLDTEDMDATIRTLKENGIDIFIGPLEKPGIETWIYFADPDNNILEYIHWYKKH